MLEAHIPQPGQVFAVGHLTVDRDHHGACVGVHHRQRFLPAGRILGQQHPNGMRADLDRAVAARDLVDRRHRGHGCGRVGAQRDGCGHGLGGIAAIHRAGQCQPHRQRQPVGSVEGVVVEPPMRAGSLEVSPGGIPVALIADDHLAAARAADRVIRPARRPRPPTLRSGCRRRPRSSARRRSWRPPPSGGVRPGRPAARARSC